MSAWIKENDYAAHLDHQVLAHKFPALFDVLSERMAQDKMWGQQNHSPEWWLMILTEEVGEWSQAVMDAKTEGAPKKNIREELVQVVAVALAMLECNDRNGWST